jgi:hypothetical protein
MARRELVKSFMQSMLLDLETGEAFFVFGDDVERDNAVDLIGSEYVVDGGTEFKYGARHYDRSVGSTYGHWAGAAIDAIGPAGCTAGPVMQFTGSGNYKAGSTNYHCQTHATGTWRYWWTPYRAGASPTQYYYGGHKKGTTPGAANPDVALLPDGNQTYDDRIYTGSEWGSSSIDVGQAYDLPINTTGINISTRYGNETGFKITSQVIEACAGGSCWFAYGLQRGDYSEEIEIEDGASGAPAYKDIGYWAQVTGIFFATHHIDLQCPGPFCTTNWYALVSPTSLVNASLTNWRIATDLGPASSW